MAHLERGQQAGSGPPWWAGASGHGVNRSRADVVGAEFHVERTLVGLTRMRAHGQPQEERGAGNEERRHGRPCSPPDAVGMTPRDRPQEAGSGLAPKESVCRCVCPGVHQTAPRATSGGVSGRRRAARPLPHAVVAPGAGRGGFEPRGSSSVPRETVPGGVVPAWRWAVLSARVGRCGTRVLGGMPAGTKATCGCRRGCLRGWCSRLGGARSSPVRGDRCWVRAAPPGLRPVSPVGARSRAVPERSTWNAAGPCVHRERDRRRDPRRWLVHPTLGRTPPHVPPPGASSVLRGTTPGRKACGLP